MREPQRSSFWVLTAVAGVCLGAAAVALSQPGDKQPQTREMATAENLSVAFRDVAKRVLPAVVSIETRTKAVEVSTNEELPFDDELFQQFFGNRPELREMLRNRRIPPREGKGSGFIIDASGIVLTNSHVVEDADRIVVRLHDGREIEARSWASDARSDVAIVRIEAEHPLPAVPLGNSDRSEIGDWVLALGNPFDIGVTVTAGIISAKGRATGINERENYLQTDAAINPGNSGGPLVNLAGEVVGINTAISTRSGGYDGVGFAIPVNMARWVAEQLVEEGRVRRAYLGVALQELTTELRRQFDIPPGKGALVGQVFPDTPASRAGFHEGDVILEFDGHDIPNRTALQELVEVSDVGRQYAVIVQRGGERVTVNVTLEEMPGDFTPALRRSQRGGNGESAREPDGVEKFGLEVTELSDEIRESLRLPDGTSGVLIRRVAPGSPASQAGLQPGDVIVQVRTTPVGSPEEFEEQTKDLSLDDGILLLIRRGTGTLFVVLKPVE
ncbi:Do family serine endopeptidase [Maioricimonas sp. JC845]|uniref:Do family serine endopeptidase n=1 Tax=Maioricimonas sp. JC845 TaxID=3232138 RepID=UPI00345A9FC9